MGLTLASDIQTISTALGAADAALVAAVDATNSSTAAGQLKVARSLIHTDATETDFDNALVWETALRKVELSLPSALGSLLSNACVTTDAYYIAQTGNKLRMQFKSGVTWTDNFRALWRKAMKEEIIVRLWSLTNTAGTWGSTVADKTIALDTALEIHTTTNITAAITLNLVLMHATGVTELVTITVPAGTASGSIIPVKATSKFTSTQSVGVIGGESGDILELWVS